MGAFNSLEPECKMKIVFYPYVAKNNMYTNIILEGLREKGVEIVPINRFFSNYKEIQIIHLNWYENITGFMDFLKKSIKLLLFKVLGKKIFWTVHNKKPHDNENFFLQTTFMKLLTTVSDKIIIHSKISRNLFSNNSSKIIDKIVYLPHPEYIDVYGVLREKKNKTTQRYMLNLLFIGMVRQYKNLELLIDCVAEIKNDVELVIAGKPQDEEYVRKLKQLAGPNKNIKFHLAFLKDKEMINYIDECDLVVLPYNTESSLNSGTVILSFSYGKSVICPEIGTISDINDKSSLLTYSYQDNIEHKKILISLIKEAIALKNSTPTIFEKWGREMKDYVSIYHKKSQFIDNLVQFYYESVI